MRVLFVPDWRKGNPYLELLSKAIQGYQKEVRVEFSNFKPGLFALFRTVMSHGRPDVLHIHWINPLAGPVLWSNHALVRGLKLFLAALDVLAVRATGTRIVWTIHNRVSHESPKPDVERRFRRMLSHLVSAVIVHSRSAVKELTIEYDTELRSRANVIPHGNYDGCYPHTVRPLREIHSALTDGKDQINILFFGAVRAYKGLERLLQALHRCPGVKCQLLIAGKSDDVETTRVIEAACAQDSRIIPALKFIPDTDVHTIFGWADIVAVPFERTLTSGSVILALTMGRPVLAPRNAEIFDVLNQGNSILYAEDQLEPTLRSLSKQRLQPMRQAARQTADLLDWARIGQATCTVYDGKRILQSL